jgi:hypothetical protein
MNRLIGKKILVLLAVWLLTGGLALADSFDLTDELQHALVDRCALAMDVDEVRESVGDPVVWGPMRGIAPVLHRCPFSELPPCSDPLLLALMQPRPEVLKTFRI